MELNHIATLSKNFEMYQSGMEIHSHNKKVTHDISNLDATKTAWEMASFIGMIYWIGSGSRWQKNLKLLQDLIQMIK